MFVAKIMHDRGMTDKARVEVRQFLFMSILYQTVHSICIAGQPNEHCVHSGNHCILQPQSLTPYSWSGQAQNEVAVLASLDHPNVVKYYECFAERGNQVKIVMELCEVRPMKGKFSITARVSNNECIAAVRGR